MNDDSGSKAMYGTWQRTKVEAYFLCPKADFKGLTEIEIYPAPAA